MRVALNSNSISTSHPELCEGSGNVNQKRFFTSFRMTALMFISVLLLGIGLRVDKYAFFPLTANAEEYLFVWSGLSLIEKGVPISWNDLPVYEEKDVYWRGVATNPGGRGELGVRLLKPWLDEPPLFSLMVGGLAKLYQLQNFTVISPYVIRLPSLFSGTISLILTYFLARKLFGYKLALLAMLLYATIPTIVFGSRLAVPENMITAIFLGIGLLMAYYLDNKKRYLPVIAIILAVIAGFAKPTGFLLIPFIVYWLWQKKQWFYGIILGVCGSLLFWLPYLAYGFYFNRELFLKVISYQSNRPAGWSSLAYLLTSPGFSTEIFLDGFIVLGFLALIFLLFKSRDKNETFLLFSFVYSLFLVIFSGGSHDQLGWYRYPIYPYLAISLALLIQKIYQEPDFFKLALTFPLLLANEELLANPFWQSRFLWDVRFYRYTFIALLIASIATLFWNKPWLKIVNRSLLVLVFSFGIVFNVLVIHFTFNILCDHSSTCALPAKVKLLSPITK